jgi:signal transduction histidine kinase
MARQSRNKAVVARACDLIRDRYRFYAAGWHGPTPPLTDQGLRRDLTAAVTLALARQDGVEGGIWQAEAGPLAYAFPTYQGTGPKTDLPAAERNQIQAVNEQAAREEQPVERQSTSQSQTLLLSACPLAGPISGLSGWTMTRVQSAPGFDRVRLGLGVLLALMLGISLWITWMLVVWSRHVRGIETALARADPTGIPALHQTGERELDRIIGALNEAGRRLAGARRESEALAVRVTTAERLAAIGRVAAGVAHEIRNPIAALRLQGENALAGDDARRQGAIGDMLEQVARLDGLVAELLSMTQHRKAQPTQVAVGPFLSTRIDQHGDQARARGVDLVLTCQAKRGVFDPEIVGRILDNLLVNAIRHTPAEGRVEVSAVANDDALVIAVEDTGPGVPIELRNRLFEPFVTGRADGTGLGLAIARELAETHGARLILRRSGGDIPGQGAAFALELPQEPGCRPS